VHRGMRTGQALFPLGFEPDIPRVRPWKELLATGAQATWLITDLISKTYKTKGIGSISFLMKIVLSMTTTRI